MKNNILFLFAPKFSELGCDVAKEYVRQKEGGKIHGLCAGTVEMMDSIHDRLGDSAGSLWHLHTEEKKWLEIDCKDDELSRIDEELGPGTLGRIIVSDRRVGRGFVHGGLCRPDNIAHLISRQPDMSPQKYVLGLYQLLEKILGSTKPDMIFCYAVAGAPGLLLGEMAKARDIPFARVTPVRIGNRYVIDDDVRGKLTCISRAYHSPDNTNLEKHIRAAREILEDFRKKPESPEYARRNRNLVKSQTPLKRSARAIISTLYELFLSFQRRELETEKIARVWFDCWLSWRRYFLRKTVFSSVIPNTPFIYFPLHVDPEASTQVLSPMHTDQLSVIEALAKSAPSNMIVVVKEHAPMLGRRPKRFYEQLQGLPRVILLGPDQDGLSLVKKAAVVAVITGTAAWEAVLLGKPAVVIGDSPHLTIGSGMIHEQCLANLPYALDRALNLSPAPDDEIVQYLAVCLAQSFEMKSSLIWGDYAKHTDDERKEVVEKFVEGLFRREYEQGNSPG